MRKSQLVYCFCIAPILLPHYILFRKLGGAVLRDFERYCEINQYKKGTNFLAFVYAMCFYRTFRNVLYYRIGKLSLFLKYVRPIQTCEIKTPNIGPGLFIEHGGATYISAKEIGSNFYINQCATVGYSNYEDAPIIGDNVQVKAGAKVFGACRIGSNSVIGANAVVLKDIPENSTVVGVPGKVIKINGKRVY